MRSETSKPVAELEKISWTGQAERKHTQKSSMSDPFHGCWLLQFAKQKKKFTVDVIKLTTKKLGKERRLHGQGNWRREVDQFGRSCT
jgi:hypothetical protein